MDVAGLVIPNWLIYVLITLVTLYIYLTWRYGELQALGIPHPKPVIPGLGNLNLFISYPGFTEVDRLLINKYGKICGMYEGRDPVIVIADVDILKQILTKDFANFTNRRHLYLRGILKHGLLDAEGDHWRHIRSLISPTFSSGKLKLMTKAMNEVGHTLCGHLSKASALGKPIEMKQYASTFSMDVIASTAFGLQLDSQSDHNNPFNVHGRNFFNVKLYDPLILISFFMQFLCPFLEKFGVVSLNKPSLSFFSGIINQTLEQRKTSNEGRVDFIKLMLDAEQHLEESDEFRTKDTITSSTEFQEKRKVKGLTHDEIIAQGLLFFLAGYETTASTMSFLIYSLAVNPAVQETLIEEIDDVCGRKDELAYEDIHKLQYLDRCIDETLRLFPAAPRVDRRALKAMTYKGVHIPKDVLTIIPIRAMHMDPEVWPNPEKFDPDRFLPEAKATRDPYNFLPFGLGPRACVGMRLALVEIKLAMVQVMRRFKFTTCHKTEVPLKLKNTLLLAAENGIWLTVQERE